MDIWRYSDWYGLGKQLRYSQKHIWHWRDWIVESLNDDKGHRPMIARTPAGDEVAPPRPDAVRAPRDGSARGRERAEIRGGNGKRAIGIGVRKPFLSDEAA